MRINRLSLLNSLFSVLNDHSPEDSNTVLALYFLENYRHLADLNIFDVAAECYVSRSSVRRFCQSIGYENFIDLKTEFLKYDDQMAHYMEHFERVNYRESLTKEINAMISEMDQRMNNQETEKIADRIYNSRFVVFLTSETSTSVIKNFQQAMVLHGKIIYLISDSYTENSLISKLDQRDYLITISATGVFAKACEEYISHVKAYKTLVTVNRDESLKKGYDRVYHLSAEDKSQDGNLVYGKYGLNYMFDVVYATYVNKYEKTLFKKG
jgi:DNA-binding MurR/RpiR family transcriptional regulator